MVWEKVKKKTLQRGKSATDGNLQTYSQEKKSVTITHIER